MTDPAGSTRNFVAPRPPRRVTPQAPINRGRLQLLGAVPSRVKVEKTSGARAA